MHLVVLAIVIFTSLIWTIKKKYGNQRELFEADQEPTIYVSVASYRDASCNATIRQLVDRAKYPSRLFFGICEQHDPADRACLQPDTFKQKVDPSHFRVTVLPPDQARGPMYARRLIHKMYKNEDFYLQIDSHMIPVQDWDVKLIDQARLCPQPSCLSTYPLQYDDPDIETNSKVAVFRKAVRGKNNLPIFKAEKIPRPSTPVKTACAAAGFVFLPKSAAQMPLWPYLPNLFQGEESIMAAQLWTRGIDIYCPSINIFSHKYYRKGEHKFWDNKPASFWDEQKKSEAFARRLITIDFPVIRPGSSDVALGTTRPISEWFERIFLHKGK